uniref:TIGR00725 family protein n=1 Tax=candidate division WOR-3 bacterium TaxID=2052148 RepID=A0A7V3ZX22_UNCW3
MRKLIGIIGPSDPSEDAKIFAEELGKLIAKEKWIVLTGGKGGIMESASKGAKEAGGITVGILPEPHKKFANKYVDIAIPTGMGEARNIILVNSSDAIVAVSLSAGTLIEIATAAKIGKIILGYGIPNIPGVNLITVSTPEEAISTLKNLLKE